MWLPLATRPQTNVVIIWKRWIYYLELISDQRDVFYASVMEMGSGVKKFLSQCVCAILVSEPWPFFNVAPRCGSSVLLCECLKKSTIALLRCSSQGTPELPAGTLVATTEIIVGMETGIPWCCCHRAKLVCKCQKNWCSSGTLHLAAKMQASRSVFWSREVKCWSSKSAVLFIVGLQNWLFCLHVDDIVCPKLTLKFSSKNETTDKTCKQLPVVSLNNKPVHCLVTYLLKWKLWVELWKKHFVYQVNCSTSKL